MNAGPPGESPSLPEKIFRLIGRIAELETADEQVIRGLDDTILQLTREAESEGDQVMLIRFSAMVGHIVEGYCGLPPDAADRYRRDRAGQYKLLLMTRATVDGEVDPDLMARLTRREVDAGRMAANDETYTLTVPGFAIPGADIGPSQEPSRPGKIWGFPRLGWGWLGLLFNRRRVRPL